MCIRDSSHTVIPLYSATNGWSTKSSYWCKLRKSNWSKTFLIKRFTRTGLTWTWRLSRYSLYQNRKMMDAVTAKQRLSSRLRTRKTVKNFPLEFLGKIIPETCAGRTWRRILEGEWNNNRVIWCTLIYLFKVLPVIMGHSANNYLLLFCYCSNRGESISSPPSY